MSSGRSGPLVRRVFPTPAGDLAVIAEGQVVVATSFYGMDDALVRLADRVGRGSDPQVSPGPLAGIEAVLARYAQGDLHALDEVEVSQPGGPFQQRAWKAMREIRAGTVDSYAGLAARAGSPRAYRAAGTVCSANMVAPFVPCHRVVASGGIGDYGYGLALKEALLRHEGVDVLALGNRPRNVRV